MQELIRKLYAEVKFCQKCGHPISLKEDHEEKIRAVCPSCSFTQYLNPIPAVAIVVINEASELLLVKRMYEPRAGMWALPSGYAEIYMSPEQNAIAEMEEETGLIGEIDHRIDWFYGFSPIYYRVLSIGFRMRVTGGTLRAGDDAEEARFFAIDALPEIAFAAHRHFINLETGLKLPTEVTA